MKRARGLGRGLDALLPASAPKKPSGSGVPSASYESGSVFSCPLDKIVPQTGQPRQHFDEAKLEELASSIREHGLLEPLVVRKKGPDLFELIAGERRWRACQKAGLHDALVVVHEVTALKAFELAIIENVQREDLDPIDMAEALGRLVSEHGYTQEKLAERIGKDRSTIANSLRLLKLPEAIRTRVVTGELSEGHGRTLLGIESETKMAEIAQKVINGRLSVRQTEALVRSAKTGGKKGPGATKSKSASVRDLEKRLERKLGARCEVVDKDGKGELKVRYGSLDELDRILDLIL
jgi:ParB family chromosome partitioning protein